MLLPCHILVVPRALVEDDAPEKLQIAVSKSQKGTSTGDAKTQSINNVDLGVSSVPLLPEK